MEAGTAPTGQELEDELAELLDQETFDPPAEFVENALLTDPAIYEEAAKDPVAWWEKQAEDLHWFEKWDTALDESNPPFYKWFRAARSTPSYNCLDRHVDDGKGDKVALPLARRGGRAARRDLRRPAGRHQAAGQRPDRQRRREGRRGRDLPADDPRGRGGHAGLRAHRRDPQRGLRRLLAELGGRAHGGLRGQAADHRRRRPAQGQDRRGQVRGRRGPGRHADGRDRDRGQVASTTTRPCRTGATCWWHDVLEAADDEHEAEPLDAEHPLFILYSSGSTATPKGILHTTGGYLTGTAWTHKYVFDLKPDEDVYWCAADVGWVTGHSYIVYGPLLNGATSVMYEGAARLPGQGRALGHRREARRDHLLLRAHGHPRVHEVGRRAPQRARPDVAAPAGHGRRAHQPEGVAVVLARDRRRALPDRGHLVADRDRATS